jgi:hypothetical protein
MRDYDHPHAFKPGDGATMHIGSDAEAYTVISVTASGKSFTMQRDKATLDPSFKPDFSPGGFVGHVSNNYDQTYDYERNPKGETRIVRLNKKGWIADSHFPVSKGRHAFYDYNF